MKRKTSITLSGEVLAQIDKHIEGKTSRSAFIELAARTYLDMISRTRRDRADHEIINRRARRLNKEAADVLKYQATQRR